MNKVVLIGRLTADPEIRQSASGKSVASYSLAVDRRFKTEGQPETDFIRCVAFGSNGDFASKYLHKGMKIAIEGRIQTSNYTKDDGTKVFKTEIVVEHHEFCEKKTSGNSDSYSYDAEPAASQDFAEVNEDDGELPF